jgi:ABC-2 type transport system permease protein
VEWIRNSQAPEGSAIGSAFVLQKPAAPQTADSNPLLAQTMAGMMIFFVFYSGAVVAMNILQEDEQGTLARLFSTPTAKGQILLGKLVSVLLVMVIQTILLLLLSSLFFGIHWGSPLSLVLADLGTIAIAGGLGLFLMSLIRSSRQSGPILGGVLTLTAMLGGLFTVSLPSIPKAFQVANLFTPQGWALRAWKLSLSGASPVDLLVPFAVMLVSGLILFAVGLFRFKRRYA